MVAVSLGVLSFIYFLLEFISTNHVSTKESAFLDDFTIAGQLTTISEDWGKLTLLGLQYGYFQKASKSFLIVKGDKKGEARFNYSNVNIAIKGQLLLNVFTGKNEY